MIVLVGFPDELVSSVCHHLEDEEVVGISSPDRTRELVTGGDVRVLGFRIPGGAKTGELVTEHLPPDARPDSVILNLEMLPSEPDFRSHPALTHARIVLDPVTGASLAHAIRSALADPVNGRSGDSADGAHGPDPADPTREIDVEVDDAWVRFQGRALDQVAVLDDLATALMEGEVPPALREQARRIAHDLASSLASWGLTEAGADLTRLEHLLEATPPRDGAHAPAAVSEIVLRIRSAVQEGPVKEVETDGHPLSGSGPQPERPILLVVDGEREFAEAVTTEARQQGLEGKVVSSLSHAARYLDEMSSDPEVVLLDLDLSEEGRDAYDFLEKLQEMHPGTAILAMSSNDRFMDRVKAARRGARRFLIRPLSSERVLAVVSEILATDNAGKFRVLAVDDDPEVHVILATLLGRQDIHLTSLQDPLRFWSVLQESDPDLVLMDVVMPNLNGLELCRVLRNDPHYQHLPLLVLTARTDVRAVERAFENGADDYIAKPIRGPELIARVKGRLERMRMARRITDSDALTGVANRRKSQEVIERYLKLATRHNDPVTLAFLDIDQMKAINDEHGHWVGDQALRHLADHLDRTFRGEDMVGRWGGEEFAVGMYGMGKAHGIHRIREVLEDIRRDPLPLPDGGSLQVSFSAGVASAPEDGEDVQSLYRHADEALYRAKGAGRNRVVGAGLPLKEPTKAARQAGSG